jgi:hypothetical protein
VKAPRRTATAVARAARAVKKRAPASPRKAAAARRNGKRGGRPAGTLPERLMAMIGDAPMNNPLRASGWASNVLLLLTQARIEGHPDIDTLAREVRANFAVMSKLTPHDILYQATKALKEEEQGRNAEDGPEEEELDGVDGAPGALRSDPPRA